MKMKTMYELGVSIPKSFTLVKRNIHNLNTEQREEILKKTEYNIFSFPASFCINILWINLHCKKRFQLRV